MKKYLFLILLLFLFCTSCKEETTINPFDTSNMSDDLVIDIKGAVLFPGVYVVSSNALIKDVIDIAGGVLVDADLEKVNLVKSITNNEMIIIPFKSNNLSNTSSLININTASQKELMNLPKIGEEKAKAIIDYRNTSGPFYTISDIQKVKGISSGIYEQIKSYITV